MQSFTNILRASATDERFNIMSAFGVQPSTDELFDLLQMTLVSTADAWRRLVFRADCQPWRLFKLLEPQSEASRQALIDEFVGARAACHSCFDTFSSLFLQRLNDPNRRSSAMACLRDVCTFARPSSLFVESQHVRFQKQPSVRGQCIRPIHMQSLTYLTSVRHAHEQRVSCVKRLVFGASSTSKRIRTHLVNQSAPCRLRARISKKRNPALGKQRATKGWDIYRQEHMAGAGQIGTADFKARLGQVKANFAGLPPDTRKRYETRAAEITVERMQLSRQSLRHTTSYANLSRNQRTTVNFRRAGVSWHEVDKHPCWSAGLGLSCANHGLKQELVDVSNSAEDVENKWRDKFGYNCAIVPNPDAEHRLETPCHLKYGGLCENDGLLHEVIQAVKNLEGILRPHRNDRQCTLLVFESGTSHKYFIVGSVALDTLLHVLIEYERLPSGHLQLVLQGGQAVVWTSHLVFNRIFADLRERELPLQAVGRIYKYNLRIADDGTQSLWFVLGSLVANFHVSAIKEHIKRKAAEPVKLPFGFVVPKKKSKRRETGAAGGRGRGHGRGGLHADHADAADSDASDHGRGSDIEDSSSAAESEDGPERPGPEATGDEDTLASTAGAAMEERALARAAEVVEEEPAEPVIETGTRHAGSDAPAAPAPGASTFFSKKLGLHAISRAPSGRASCFACHQKIPKSSIRFHHNYNVRRPESYVHPECIGRLGMGEVMTNSISFLEEEMLRPHDDALHNCLETALAFLIAQRDVGAMPADSGGATSSGLARP